MAIVLGLACAVAVVTAAVKGLAYRGAYFALAVAAFVAAALAMVMTPSGLLLASSDPAERAGAAFLRDYLPPVALWLCGVAFGGIIGGIAFRGKATK